MGLLFPHMVYKSYPESFLTGERWHRLGKWLGTVSSFPVPTQDAARIGDVDDWIEKLQDSGHFVSCSSGTTGKSAMLVASQEDMQWCMKESVAAYAWGSGVVPNRDRRIFGLAAVARVSRNLHIGAAYEAALQNPNHEPFRYPLPPITVGGLKRARLPDDYREFVYETFSIVPERNYQNYSMQELHSSMPRCRKGGRCHLPPWLVLLTLNKEGDELLPMTDSEIEGRGAFFDLSLDGRWGGVISGDRIAISLDPCVCGAKSPSVRDDIARYVDLEGDDKIGCAGTVDEYVRGVASVA